MVLSGKIVEEGSGKPIAGVQIVLRDTASDNNAVDDTTTDANGNFAFNNNSNSGGLWLDVYKDGYGAASIQPGYVASNGGNISLYKLESSSGVPKWVWLVAALAIVTVLYFVILKNKK